MKIYYEFLETLDWHDVTNCHAKRTRLIKGGMKHGTNIEQHMNNYCII